MSVMWMIMTLFWNSIGVVCCQSFLGDWWTYGTHEYHYAAGIKFNTDALAYCQSHGARFVSVKTQQEFDFLSAEFTRYLCNGECAGLLGTAGVWLDLIVNESHTGACPADDPASDECVRSGYTWFDESSVLWDMWQSLGFQFNLPLNQQVPYWQLPTAKIQFPQSDSIRKFVVCQREICSSTLKLGNIDYCAMQTTESVDYVTSQQRCSDVNMMTIEHWSRDQVTALQATEYHQSIRAHFCTNGSKAFYYIGLTDLNQYSWWSNRSSYSWSNWPDQRIVIADICNDDVWDQVDKTDFNGTDLVYCMQADLQCSRPVGLADEKHVILHDVIRNDTLNYSCQADYSFADDTSSVPYKLAQCQAGGVYKPEVSRCYAKYTNTAELLTEAELAEVIGAAIFLLVFGEIAFIVVLDLHNLRKSMRALRRNVCGRQQRCRQKKYSPKNKRTKSRPSQKVDRRSNRVTPEPGAGAAETETPIKSNDAEATGLAVHHNHVATALGLV